MEHMTPAERARFDRIHESQRIRLVDANRRWHAEKAPGCTTEERYSIPCRGGGRMDGIGCEKHGIFLSWAKDRPLP